MPSSFSRSPSADSRRRRRSYSRSRSPRRRHWSPSSERPRQGHHYRSRSPRGKEASDPARRRDYSPSPRRHYRSRSRSRPRQDEGEKRKMASKNGFKWKENPKSSADEPGVDRHKKSLQRGYNAEAEHAPARDDIRSKFGNDFETKYARGRTAGADADLHDKFGSSASRHATGGQDGEKKKEKTKKHKEKPLGPRPTDEPMIIVNVNDRLGTKAAIPCLASDPVRLFKAQVAARIGREPHEIMLKRQGERPFKDQLTLEDYGVSNGVQLDLEVDTGD